MATEPSSAAAAGILYKLGISAVVGMIGGAIMAAVDPPSTRKELFLQGASSGVGSMVFGPAALGAANHFFPVVDPSMLEWAIPVYFIVGALSWGVFGAIAKVRRAVSERAADVISEKAGLK